MDHCLLDWWACDQTVVASDSGEERFQFWASVQVELRFAEGCYDLKFWCEH